MPFGEARQKNQYICKSQALQRDEVTEDLNEETPFGEAIYRQWKKSLHQHLQIYSPQVEPCFSW